MWVPSERRAAGAIRVLDVWRRQRAVHAVRAHPEMALPMKNKLRILRAERNWTQADLAKHIGISRQGLNAIETGKFVPSTLLALRMAKVFNTTVEVLFQLDDLEE